MRGVLLAVLAALLAGCGPVTAAPGAVQAEAEVPVVTKLKPPPDPASRAKFRRSDPEVIDAFALINKTVNGLIQPVTDADHYGVDDLWVMWPADLKGDCEDYVITKLSALNRAGVPVASHMKFTMIMMPDGGAHAVLEVLTPQGEVVVLDNRFDDLMTVDELKRDHGYVWPTW